MKQFRSLMSVLLAILLAVMTLTGCSSKSAYRDDYYEPQSYNTAYDSAAGVVTESYAEEYWFEDDMKSEVTSAATAFNESEVQPDMSSKLIYTATINVETVTYEDTVANIRQLIEKSGGYIQDNSSVDYGGYRSCYFTIRVPQENYRSFVTAASGLEMVTSFNESVENVSQSYYDTQARLESAKKELAGYQALYEQAEDVEDMITISQAINDVQYKIDYLSGELRNYDALVSYSTISIDVEEVSRLRGSEVPPTSFGQRMSSAFKNGWRNTVNGFQDLLVDIAYGWFGWLVFIAIVVVATILIRRSVKKKKAAKAQALQQMQQMQPQQMMQPMQPQTMQQQMMPTQAPQENDPKV